MLQPREGRQEQTPSRASTQNKSEAAGRGMTITASEAAARGYTSERPAPPPTTCEYCGRTLEHEGIIAPFAAGKILLWSPSPQRCTCDGATEYWARHDQEEKEREAEEKRRQQQAAVKAKIDRLIRDSGMGGRFQNRTFERWELTEQNRRAYNICRRYADAFKALMLPEKDGNSVRPPKKERNGIFMIGGYGTGKTHLAAAIANHLLRDGTAVICMTMIDLLARIKETYDRSDATEAQVMRLYAEVPLLIIDDLGSEQPTEWGSTTIFSIINSRYEGYMPTIVTTNCGADELVQRMTPRDASDHNAKKTVDRLREMCVGIEMNWASWRAK